MREYSNEEKYVFVISIVRMISYDDILKVTTYTHIHTHAHTLYGVLLPGFKRRNVSEN